MTLSETAVGWSEPVSYAHYRPLSEAADRFVAEAQTDQRLQLGIEPLDHQMRGISAGHLALIVGYSHSGKTLVVMHTIRHNADKRILWFMPDEPPPLVLAKLASATWRISAAELEDMVRRGDPDGLRILHETVEAYPNLAVVSKPLTPRTMRGAYDEVCDVWGAAPDGVVADYLDLLQVGDGSLAKVEFFKAFISEREVPGVGLHQTSRTAGARGQAMRIDSGNYGGETAATFQIGVWRKKAAIGAELTELEAKTQRTDWTEDRIAHLYAQLDIHRYTISVNLNKNKRPGGQLVDEVDMELFLDTGVLAPLDGDLPVQCRRRGLRVISGTDPYHRYDNGEVPWS